MTKHSFTRTGNGSPRPSMKAPYSLSRQGSFNSLSSSMASDSRPLAPSALLAQLDDSPLEDWEKNPYEDDDAVIWNSARGWMNLGTIFLLCGGIISVFLGMPIVAEIKKRRAASTATELSTTGAISSALVVSALATSLIDADTPTDVYTRTGFDGNEWNLVFSDEFEKDGRTFYPGDDPFFEAVDLHYWGTNDFEWYDPSAITTRDGKLVITMSEEPIHNLDFKSGMLQSWNKLCFSGSMYYEVKLLLPGNNEVGGFWPGVWSFGNLGRAGYGATTDGTWPYSYSECDIGTLPNQTWVNGTGPYDALHSPSDTSLSYLPGQRMSACTCPGEDHAGPNVTVGRGVPEIDLLEAQIVVSTSTGQVSQTLQMAPYSTDWKFNYTTATVYDDTLTSWNSYTGGQYQQSCSGLTDIPSSSYVNTTGEYKVYAYESYANPNDRENGYVAWVADGVQSWTMHANGIGPDNGTEVGQRLIPEEPMSLVFNFGMSNNFENVEFNQLIFPNEMQLEYVRIYQRSDFGTVGCDPADYPTADYIAAHANAYNNPNLTTWAGAGYTMPKNSLSDTC